MSKNEKSTKAVADTALTNAEKELLEAIVVTLNIMADENEISGQVEDLEHALLLDSWKYAGCELRSYMNRLRKWMQTSTDSFIMACCLMKRLDEGGFLPSFTQTSIHRIFLVCLVTAIKVHEDVTLSNAGFAKVGGLSVQDFNAMERYVILSLNWKCQVSLEEFESMERDILAVSRTMISGEADATLQSRVPITFAGLVKELHPEPIQAVAPAKPRTLKKSRMSFRKMLTRHSVSARSIPEVGPVINKMQNLSMARQDSC